MATTTLGAMPVVKKAINWSIVLSILMIVAGVLAIFLPPIAGIAMTILVGWLLVFGGILHFTYAWRTRHDGGVVWGILLGALYVLVGGYMLWNPIMGLVSLTMALAIWLFVEAGLEFMLAFQLKPLFGWGWLLINGILSLVLGLMIALTWPLSSAWAVGTLMGLSMLCAGIARLMISLAARNLVSTAARAP